MTPQKLVTLIARIIVFCSAIVILSYVVLAGFDRIVPQCIRFGLTCLLARSLIRGWTPGRWITILLLGLGGFMSIVGSIELLTPSGGGLGLLILGVVYSACVIGLLTPTASMHFSKKEEGIFDNDPVRECPNCHGEYKFSEYRTDAEKIFCSTCKTEIEKI
jgi:hypothetical protein